jgi:hypothetical protein
VERVAGRALMVVPHRVRVVRVLVPQRVPVHVQAGVLPAVQVVPVVPGVALVAALVNVAAVLVPVVPAAVAVPAVRGRRGKTWQSTLKIFKTGLMLSMLRH